MHTFELLFQNPNYLMLSPTILDYLLFSLLVLLFLGPPTYLWIKWIRNEIKNKNKVALMVSIFSFLLFISSFIIIWFGAEKAFELNSIKPTNTGANSFILLLIALAIPPMYFYSEWVYQAIKSKNKLSVILRLSYVLLFASIIMPNYFNTILGYPNAYVVTGFTIFFILFATLKRAQKRQHLVLAHFLTFFSIKSMMQPGLRNDLGILYFQMDYFTIITIHQKKI